MTTGKWTSGACAIALDRDRKIAEQVIRVADHYPRGADGRHADGYDLAVLETCERFLPLVSDDSRYWNILAAAWIAGGSSVYAERWATLFRASRPKRERLMKGADRRTHARIPKRVTAYRGCREGEDADRCLAWSLSLSVAERFATMYGTGVVEVRTFPRERVLVYWTRRGEGEIIVLPEVMG